MQRLPRCFECSEPVEHDPIFEAPCGHDDHASAVFHGLCLMKWREHVQHARAAMQKWVEEHAEHDPGYGPS